MAIVLFPFVIYSCLCLWQEAWTDYRVRATAPYEHPHRLVDMDCRANLFGGKHFCHFEFRITGGDRRVFEVSYHAFRFHPDGIRMVRDADTGRITTDLGVAEAFDRLVHAIVFYLMFFLMEAVLLVDLFRPLAERTGLMRPVR